MNSNRNLVIRASAGTGKTFQLSNRYLSLLAEGVPGDQILAVTFTRKAAGEILQRIVLRLARAALSDQECRQLRQHLDQPSLTRTACLELLQRLITQMHRLAISTLDSFFAQIASAFTLELGMPPGWKIVEEVQDERLRALAVEIILRADSTAVVTRLMNLITKGDAQRSVSELVQSTVNDLYSLYLETEAEAWSRFPDVTSLSEHQLHELLESLRSAALPNAQFQAALQADLDSATASDWESILKKGIAAKLLEGDSTYNRTPIPAELAANYRQLIEHARSVLIRQLASQTTATYDLLRKFDEVYQQLKYNTRSMRFEDITRRLRQSEVALRHEPLEYRLDCQLMHLLIDEFQDTSLTQWQVIRPLAQRITSASRSEPLFPQEHSLLCVGDVKQAIYGWRGGKSAIFDTLEKGFTGLASRQLTESYRSAQPVIDTVNQIFANLNRHSNLEKLAPAIDDWCRHFPPHSTARHELAGYTCLVAADQAAEEDDDQAAVTLEFAAQRIAAIAHQAPGHSLGVLTRKNATVARLIYLLRDKGVHASEEGGNPLTDSPPVQTILSLLTLADHPRDSVARFHVQSSPLARIVGGNERWEQQEVYRLATGIRAALLQAGYGPTLYGWARAMTQFCDRRDTSRLQQLVELAYEYQSIATLRPADFVRFVRRQRVSDPMPADVRVMTVHQAKGLQFDIVVLPELDESINGQPDPCVTGQSDPTQPIDRVCMYRNSTIQSILPDELKAMFESATYQHTNESLCVLYVAVTRAIHALHMIIQPSKSNERTLHKSHAGLLRAALTDGSSVQPRATLFENGDPQWYRHQLKRTPVEKPTADQAAASIKPLRIELASQVGARQRGLTRTSPSSLEGGSRVPLSDVLRVGNRPALARGTVMHAWFEQIQWLDDGLAADQTLRHAVRNVDLGSLDLDALLQEFHAYLRAPAIAALLTKAHYLQQIPLPLKHLVADPASRRSLRLQVSNERRFAVRMGTGIVSGSIDRFVLLFDQSGPIAADVIDFKTDAISDVNDSQRAIRQYEPQIRAYRSAVAKMYRLPLGSVSARLVLLATGEVCDLAAD